MRCPPARVPGSGSRSSASRGCADPWPRGTTNPAPRVRLPKAGARKPRWTVATGWAGVARMPWARATSIDSTSRAVALAGQASTTASTSNGAPSRRISRKPRWPMSAIDSTGSFSRSSASSSAAKARVNAARPRWSVCSAPWLHGVGGSCRSRSDSSSAIRPEPRRSAAASQGAAAATDRRSGSPQHKVVAKASARKPPARAPKRRSARSSRLSSTPSAGRGVSRSNSARNLLPVGNKSLRIQAKRDSGSRLNRPLRKTYIRREPSLAGTT